MTGKREAKPPKEKKPKKPRKPWTVKRILVWVAVGVVGIFIAYSCVAAPIMAANALKGQVSASLGVTTLQEKDIQNTIGGTGTVDDGTVGVGSMGVDKFPDTFTDDLDVTDAENLALSATATASQSRTVRPVFFSMASTMGIRVRLWVSPVS